MRTDIVRAVLAGAASGSRTFAAPAAATVTARRPTGRLAPLARFARGRARTFVLLAAGGELVGDKLPVVPSRTQPPAAQARLAAGAVTAAWLARRAGSPVLPALALGGAAAAATTYAGPGARAAVAARVGRDLPGAVAEDVLAYGLAVTAAVLARRPR